tara:strand:+ start:53106 stop:53768 length:663 start_codon:yes stop_codon:yes gene_type:complete
VEPASLPASDAQSVVASPVADAGGNAVDLAAADVDPAAFVDVRSIDPEILLDMRYAGENNFAKRIVYPKARCLLRAPVAAALGRVQARLRAQGLQLLLWDCYRPFHVQEAFWKLVPDSKYVAKPTRRDGKPWRGSKHNRGAAVDLSLADANGTPLLMPTDHDDFSERAHRDAIAIPKAAANNAKRLDEAMRLEGFQGIETEWWHFDHAGWKDYELSDQGL